MRPSTKQCPRCGCTTLVPIRTQNIKLCPDCPSGQKEIPWLLDEGQAPVGYSVDPEIKTQTAGTLDPPP